jgi:hypothetical protein
MNLRDENKDTFKGSQARDEYRRERTMMLHAGQILEKSVQWIQAIDGSVKLRHKRQCSTSLEDMLQPHCEGRKTNKQHPFLKQNTHI